MRVWLTLLALAALALSGCAGNDDPPSEGEQAPPSSATDPEPVTISERHDLSMGMDSTSWSFKVGEAATHSSATIRLTGVEDTSIGRAGDFCFTYKTPDGEGGTCRLGNVNVQTSVFLDLILYENQGLEPGQYSFTFSSPPNVAELLVDANVQYA